MTSLYDEAYELALREAERRLDERWVDACMERISSVWGAPRRVEDPRVVERLIERVKEAQREEGHHE